MNNFWAVCHVMVLVSWRNDVATNSKIIQLQLPKDFAKTTVPGVCSNVIFYMLWSEFGTKGSFSLLFSNVLFSRDKVKTSCNSTCGTYKQYPHPTNPPTSVHSGALLRRYAPTASAHSYVTTCNKELSRVSEDAEKQFPDLLESSPTNKLAGSSGSSKYLDNFSTGRFYEGGASRAASDSGSVSDINEIFCTLPRKKDLAHSARYRSSDSQSPLLPESRYGEFCVKSFTILYVSEWF